MSLIRKPDVEVFRDSTAVVALRGAKELVTEGAGGVARTFTRIWLSFATIGFMAAGLGALFSVSNGLQASACLALVGGAGWGLWALWRAPTRDGAVEDGPYDPAADISVPLPEHLRGGGLLGDTGFRIAYWPRAFVNQASLLFIGGFFLMFMEGRGFGVFTALGVVMVARGVLLLSIFFGGRTCVAATDDRLTVRSLLGDGTLYWSDITSVAVGKSGRRDGWTPLKIGSRHYICVKGFPSLGAGELLIPYKLLGLDKSGVGDLVGRIRGRAAAAQARREYAAVPATPHAVAPPPRLVPASPAVKGFDPDAIMSRYLGQREPGPRLAPASPAGDDFDPDAIMARYLAQREAASRAAPPLSAPRPDGPSFAAPAVRTFGRKRA
jgi:hypothetical protein